MKTIKCKYCRGTHKVVNGYYHCPKCFGGWVCAEPKKKRTPKVYYYNKCLYGKLDGTWEWSANIWFSEGIFADCTIKSAKPLGTSELAWADLDKMLVKFGINKGNGEV